MQSINILQCLVFLCLRAAWTSSGTGGCYTEATDTSARPECVRRPYFRICLLPIVLVEESWCVCLKSRCVFVIVYMFKINMWPDMWAYFNTGPVHLPSHTPKAALCPPLRCGECWVIDWSMCSLISQLNSNTLARSTSLSYQTPHVSRWHERGKRFEAILRGAAHFCFCWAVQRGFHKQEELKGENSVD